MYNVLTHNLYTQSSHLKLFIFLSDPLVVHYSRWRCGHCALFSVGEPMVINAAIEDGW